MRFNTNDHIKSINLPPIGEVRAWAATRLPDASELIDLCQAVPDYCPPDEMLSYMQQLVRDPQTCRYTPDEGLPEVREAICARYHRRYKAKIRTDQLCLTVGASQAFWLAMLVLCRAGDEVILQSPCYFDHPMGLAAMGVRPVYAAYNENEHGIPNPAAIERLITPRTRAILLVTPSNPTGVTIPQTRLTELYFLAQRHRIALVLDESYADFVDGLPHDLFTLPDWYNNLIHIMSFGKSYALTGYRAGLLAAAPEFIRQALKIQDSMTVCQPHITQMALKYGMENLDYWIEEKRLMMSLRNSLFAAEFVKPGNRFRMVSSGGFFAWVKHPFNGKSSRAAAQHLARVVGIMTLPGEAFGPGLGEYLRLALGNIKERQIQDIVTRFRQAV